jgi:hypothetical protein
MSPTRLRPSDGLRSGDETGEVRVEFCSVYIGSMEIMNDNVHTSNNSRELDICVTKITLRGISTLKYPSR